jgi:GTP-binding protein
MVCTIALVGRPNVGKSTLFNRLSTKKKAIVHDAPGITRDRQYTEASLGDMDFRLVDTAGLFSLNKSEIEAGELSFRAHAQTYHAIDEADLIWFLLDGLEGVTAEDREIARTLHKQDKPVIVIVNKCESQRHKNTFGDFYRLGFGDPIAISAEHKEGFVDLFDVLRPFASDKEAVKEKDKSIKLAIVGRPNVGKSTFINQVIGEERLVTSAEAGTTRDSVEVDFSFGDQKFQLMDTAGLRRQSRVETLLEKQIVEQTKTAIQYAECVILMMDATQPLEKQDMTIARQVVEEGRAMVIVLNKSDQIENTDALMKEVHLELENLLSQAKGIPVIMTSSLKKKNLDSVFRAIIKLYKIWEKRVSTGALNRWLEDILSQNPPPLVNGTVLKIRYVTQIKARPPTFALFVTRAKHFPESYLRYLRNSIRMNFGFEGVPIRFLMRETKNPYANK